MKLFVLDTDILALLQRGDANVVSRASKCAPAEIAVTVITVDEQLRGWFTLVRRAKTPRQIAFAYDQLALSVSDLARIRILSYSETAIARFNGLCKSKLSVRGNDLRIASIALEYNATVVTRNTRDFSAIPGLSLEDWSK
jgi:tRNA(fMet)-specific endonuclease VapC